MGEFYGIGVGPGDPELLTLKAHRIFNVADVIFCPEKEAGIGSFAFDTTQELLEDIKTEIVSLAYPMHYHGTQLREIWKQNVGCIARYLNGGRTGASTTLGDPVVYGISIYTLLYIEEVGVEVEVVFGVTSFCAVADFMKISLMVWNEDLVVAPMCKNSSGDLGRALREHDNVVLMKSFIDPQAPLKALKENYLEDRSVLITKTGTGEECLVADFEELERYDIPHPSMVIIRKQGRQ